MLAVQVISLIVIVQILAVQLDHMMVLYQFLRRSVSIIYWQMFKYNRRISEIICQ